MKCTGDCGVRGFVSYPGYVVYNIYARRHMCSHPLRMKYPGYISDNIMPYDRDISRHIFYVFMILKYGDSISPLL